MGLLEIAVEGFEVEIELAEVLRLELFELQLEGDEAVEGAVEEQEVEREVAPADLERDLAAEEAEVAAQLGDEGAQAGEQRAVQVGLGVVVGQAEELEDVGVLEDLAGTPPLLRLRKPTFPPRR